MENGWIIFIMSAVLFLLFYIAGRSNKDKDAQRILDNYLNSTLSNVEIGRSYERYIGYLYEQDGYNVDYHGALNGIRDLGRDLIVSSDQDILIVQTKCWSKYKIIREKDIFQLFGSMRHFKLTAKTGNRIIRPVFYTTTKYSRTARDVAKVLGLNSEFKNLTDHIQ